MVNSISVYNLISSQNFFEALKEQVMEYFLDLTKEHDVLDSSREVGKFQSLSISFFFRPSNSELFEFLMAKFCLQKCHICLVSSLSELLLVPISTIPTKGLWFPM